MLRLFIAEHYSTAVFFNLCVVAESSANVCVAHGTLCNDPSVYSAFVINL